jgi:hypothetical protein
MKPRRIKTIVILISLGVLTAAACTRPTIDGSRQPPVFRGRWWNYYERSLSAADARDYHAARADLDEAIALRNRDQRMARTYGMHFVDYFPHRELGVIHWLTGDLQSALTELERSIEHYPTAKARFYLDAVRKALIQQRGDAGDPPELVLDIPSAIVRTRADPFLVRGTARDPDYVAAINVMGEPVFLEGSRQRIAFSHPLRLPQGRYTIEVSADNLAGQTDRRQFTLVVDRAGPLIMVDRFDREGRDGLVEGTVLDDAGVASIEINGRQLPFRRAGKIPFAHRLPENETTVTIVCRDSLGNRTIAVLDTVREDMTQSVPTKSIQNRWVAGLELNGIFNAPDRQPPALSLDDWHDTQTVYMDKVVISGHVRDADNVVSLAVNHQEVLSRPGVLAFFSHVINLRPGPNTITLTALDSQGHRSIKQIGIERKIPAAKLLDHRLRITIFPFDQKGDFSAASYAFQDNFIHHMVKPARFQVVERSRLDVILQEHKISRSRLIERNTAIRLGRLAAAQAIITGSLVETRTGIEIVGRVVDSETSEILTTIDAYSESKDLSGFRTMSQALSLKIHREFPLCDGRVVDRQGNLIYTDLGGPQLRVQRRLLVYAEKPVVDPATGRKLGMDHRVIGQARVTQVQEHHSKATLQEGAEAAIDSRHKVVPQ